MGFLKRAIQNGIQKGVGDAIGNAVRQVIEPTATDLANKAADSIDQTAKQTEGSVRRSSGFDDAMANLKRSAESYATEAAKNIKVCPSCSQPCSADKKFCENCGAKLPETTVAQASVCSACGKQNTVGTKFCCDCVQSSPQRYRKNEQKTQEAKRSCQNGMNFCRHIRNGVAEVFRQTSKI